MSAPVVVGEDGSIKATIRDPRKVPGYLADELEDVQVALMMTPAGEALGSPEQSDVFQELNPGAQMRLVGLDGMRAFRELVYATLVAHVESWSYEGIEQEVSRDAFSKVPGPDRKALSDKVGEIIKATGGMKVDVTPPKPGELDTNTPSGPSSV